MHAGARKRAAQARKTGDRAPAVLWAGGKAVARPDRAGGEKPWRLAALAAAALVAAFARSRAAVLAAAGGASPAAPPSQQPKQQGPASWDALVVACAAGAGLPAWLASRPLAQALRSARSAGLPVVPVLLLPDASALTEAVDAAALREAVAAAVACAPEAVLLGGGGGGGIGEGAELPPLAAAAEGVRRRVEVALMAHSGGGRGDGGGELAAGPAARL